MIKALEGKVLVTDIQKGERMIGRIIIANDDGKQQGVRPRWGKVYSVGSDIKDLEIGEWILIEHGRWTRPVILDEVEYYAVDNECILASCEEEPKDETLVDV